jgi:hypothetical protein
MFVELNRDKPFEESDICNSGIMTVAFEKDDPNVSDDLDSPDYSYITYIRFDLETLDLSICGIDGTITDKEIFRKLYGYMLAGEIMKIDSIRSVHED